MKSFSRCLLRSVATILLLSVPSAAIAASESDADLPLWEIGVAGIGAYVPDYPASGHSQLTGFALPIVTYRGDLFLFSADSDGVQGAFQINDRTTLTLGLDAAFSAKSKDNAQRRGLPDLDYLVEIGPSLEYRFWEDGDRRLTAIAQVRAAFAVDTDLFDYTGVAVEPQLIYTQDTFLLPELQLTLGLSSKFAYDGLNQYFYDVAPQFATPDRCAYRAHDGYQQTALSTKLFLPVSPRLSVFALGQLLYDDGAANENSPLYRDDFTYALGLGLAYSLFVSERTAGDAGR